MLHSAYDEFVAGCQQLWLLSCTNLAQTWWLNCQTTPHKQPPPCPRSHSHSLILSFPITFAAHFFWLGQRAAIWIPLTAHFNVIYARTEKKKKNKMKQNEASTKCKSKLIMHINFCRLMWAKLQALISISQSRADPNSECVCVCVLCLYLCLSFRSLSLEWTNDFEKWSRPQQKPLN